MDVIKKALWRVGLKEDKEAAAESAVKEEVLWYSRTGAREMPLALAEDIRRRAARCAWGAPWWEWTFQPPATG